MILKIIQDSITYPYLFNWFYNVSEEKLKKWLGMNKMNIPNDYFEFLCLTGGGDIFESETLLGPFVNENSGDEIISNNNYFYEKGMSKDYLVFHTGMSISVIDLNHFQYNVLDENFFIREHFRSFDSWYMQYIRKEFSDRYNLK